jgi:hypothetical protein
MPVKDRTRAERKMLQKGIAVVPTVKTRPFDSIAASTDVRSLAPATPPLRMTRVFKLRNTW